VLVQHDDVAEAVVPARLHQLTQHQPAPVDALRVGDHQTHLLQGQQQQQQQHNVERSEADTQQWVAAAVLPCTVLAMGWQVCQALSQVLNEC
jgi:hypothetical protein